MGKLIRLDIQGDFDSGFSVTAQILEDSAPFPLIAGDAGKLPRNLDIDIKEAYRNWQTHYRSIVAPIPKFPLTDRPSVENVSGNIQENNFEPFRRETQDLITNFNKWLKHQHFQPIELLLRTHLEPGEENRILLLTNNPWLRKLPWHEWDLLKDFSQTEVGFSSPNFKKLKQLSASQDKVKILAILGYQADIASQGQPIQDLENNVEVTWLKQPKREELDEPLWKQQWDILFFVGHGESQDDWKTGTIGINENDKITIGELRNHFKKAIDNGLKLAILNCCDGLGLAHSLAEGEDLYLPQMIVMREELPVAVAPRFLQYLLEEFTQGNSLYASVRKARRRLQILEKEFPCVSNLPVICQNPAVKPLRWHDLVIPPNPYQGLSAFQEKDTALFFGRETFTNQLVKAVETKKLVAVIGASGSGKSSVVLAGLIPSLRQQGNWLIANLRPESTPFENLAKALLSPMAQLETGENEGVAEINAEAINQLATDLQEGNRTLSDVVKSIGSSRRFLLVIDQFEEIYTYPNQKSRQFLDCLLDAVQNLSAFRLAITLRTDFLNEAIEYNPFREQLDRWKPEFIGVMLRTELQAAIEEPAKQRNVYLEAGLTEHILNDVGGEQGSLPLLEFALTELWKQQENGWLTRLKYAEIGGVEKALCRHAEGVYDALKKKEGAQERTKQIFMKLVSPGEGTEYTRQLATRAEVGEENWDLVTHLATARLVVSNRNETTEIETVEIVHEALIKAWPDLRKWIEDNDVFLRWKERLKVAFLEWERNENKEGYLLQGAPLGEAEGYLLQRLEDISKAERVFIQLGLGLRDRNRRRTILGLTSGLVAVSIFAVGALWQWRQAEITKSDVMARSADILFSQGRELDALMEGLRARVLVQRLKAEPSRELEGTLQQVVSGLRERNRLETHSLGVKSVSFSPDGKILASGSGDETIKLWDVTTGQEIRTLNGYSSFVRSVSFSPDGKTLVSGNADKTVKLWDVNTGEKIRTLKGHGNEVYGVSFSPDGKTLASGSGDKTIKLWDVNTGEEIRTLKGHGNEVKSVSFSPDGKTLASGSNDKTVKLWDVNTGKEILTLKGRGGFSSVSFSPDGKTLASGNGDNTIKLWDVSTGQEIRTLKGHSAVVESVSFSPDGKTLASGSDDNTIKMWDVTTGEEIRTFKGHSDLVYSVNFSPDGKTLVSGSLDSTIKLWDVITGQEIQALKGHISVVMSVSFSPDGKLGSGSADNTIKLWDVITGQEIRTLKGHSNGVYSVSFSPDGKTLVSGSTDNTIKLWDVITGQEIHTLKGHSKEVNSVSFSPDGKTLASGSDDNTIKLWDVTTGQEFRTFNEDNMVWSVSFHPDSKTFASANLGDITLWNTNTYWSVNRFKGHSDVIKSVSFSPDGKTLASGALDGTIKLWDVTTRQEIRIIRGHSNWVNSLNFSPDGKILASGSNDKTVKLWDVSTGQEIRTLKGHSHWVMSVSFSPDGKTLASGSADKTVILWNLNFDDLLVRGCDKVRAYLHNPSANVSDSDRHLCDGISKGQ